MFASRPQNGRAQKERRPAGVSRRRKTQFSFETLEDRRVMTASTPVAALIPLGTQAVQMGSLSSATPEGDAAIFARDLYWQMMIAAAQSAGAASNVAPASIPTDPLLSKQWHLINSGQNVGSPDFQPIFGVPGQDINVAPVWNMGLTGQGVKVGVFDSGVQTNHPDLAANIDTSLQFDAITGDTNANPDNVGVNPVAAHGTSVAGLIGAVANNGIGGAGVAPGVTLVPVRLIDNFATPQSFVDAFRYALEVGLDVTNNSWQGTVARGINPMSTAEALALRDTILFGRNGLGIIHVISSGNNGGARFNDGFQDLGFYDSSVYDGYQNSRYTITVGGVDHDGFYNNVDGTVTGYPEAGPNVLVAAPTGSVALEIADETDIGSGIITTDVTGDDGFNASPDPITGQEINDPFYPAARDFLNDPDYTSRFNGTSASAPLVSGVVALMLQANPNLSWRDVQEILVRSARQTGEFDIPTDGFGFSSQNIWMVNQMPIFRDPDPFGTSDPFTDTFDPSLQPVPPTLWSNGAGYTVSQGYGAFGEQLGYGHGVIDAELAVQLAQQWTSKNQTLAPELTYTTFVSNLEGSFIDLPSAERGSQDSGFQVVPGGLGGQGGFIDYWNEYFVDEPFTGDDPPTLRRGNPLPIVVPASNSMSVETIEVKVSISGGTVDLLNHLRLALVSPSGTHSELNANWLDLYPAPSSLQTLIPGIGGGDPGSVDTTGGNFVWSFTTNRNWGERSDGVWQLVFENYDFDTDLQVEGIEVAFHGAPINANTQRIMGFVGLDDDRDDTFAFSRLDQSPENWAPNTTVSLRRTSDNALVKQFVVGADGNYYFDVAPDNYVITVEDPLGRAAQDDSINATPQYLAQWTVTAADFVNATNEGFNFLLDPGPPVPQQAVFSGVVYADVNGDGVYNGDDVNMPNVRVFGDVNRNGALDAGEMSVVTNATGQYSLTVPVTQSSVINVGVIRPVNWTSTNDGPGTADSKTDGLESLFVVPGSAISNMTFAIKPPANNIGGGGASLPGILLGVVYEDANNNQSRQAGEAGVTNTTVFIDNNNNGVPDAGDTVTTTNEHGAYVFTNVPAGNRVVRALVVSPLVQTAPAPGFGRVVNLTGSSTISGAPLQFGVRNTATLDFGDLPAIYGATLSGENGARHKKSAYWLGSTVDSELDGHPSDNADGDDLAAPFDDEDGITFDPIVPGSSAHIVVTASRAGGVLQGWVDWNNDGDFNDVGERILTDKALVAGANDVFFSVPAGANVNQVYARFRYGEHSLGGAKPIGTPFGLADLGEVEDYKLSVAVPAVPQVQGLPSDADRDGDVDGNDFLAWQRNVGKTSGATQAQGDANGDGKVSGSDLASWKQSFGAIVSATPAQAILQATSGDFDGDGDVDGADFLALQQGVGLGFPSLGAGDGNHDGVVDTDDVTVWAQAYGEQSATSSAASLAAASSATSSAESKSFAAASVVGVSPTAAAESVPVTASMAVAAAGGDKAVFGLGGRPFTDLVRNLTAPEKTLRERAAVLREAAETAIADATGAWDEAAHDFLHQDRAFADLIGSRRRQGLRMEGGVDLAAAVADCDEAFAALADHFDWPRG
jgi:subtilisin family serine protease